jgi:hypothetical protein|uniref:Uncharacterized protein n=1 Tax=viral metagenome TaxID=1070528 RepID=A0A6C0EEI2_9ZZZZ
MINLFFANIIYYFHILIILFIIITPFIDNVLLLILHIVFCLCLFLHWYLNSDECILTLIECKLRNIKKINSFIYEFISPMYNINKTKFYNLIWIITLIMFLFSIYNLYNSKSLHRAIIYYNNLPEINKKNFEEILNIMQNKK